MTPEQKWRAEAIGFLSRGAGRGINYWNELSNEEIYKALVDKTKDLNYLTSEYIINVKQHKETQQHIVEIKSQKHLS